MTCFSSTENHQNALKNPHVHRPTHKKYHHAIRDVAIKIQLVNNNNNNKP